MLFAGNVIPAELGRPSHAGPSAMMPPVLPFASGLNHWSSSAIEGNPGINSP
jgi:hypothetical protein